jgi:hypothetical protein
MSCLLSACLEPFADKELRDHCFRELGPSISTVYKLSLVTSYAQLHATIYTFECTTKRIHSKHSYSSSLLSSASNDCRTDDGWPLTSSWY